VVVTLALVVALVARNLFVFSQTIFCVQITNAQKLVTTGGVGFLYEARKDNPPKTIKFFQYGKGAPLGFATVASAENMLGEVKYYLRNPNICEDANLSEGRPVLAPPR